jgi:hypothetical protein
MIGHAILVCGEGEEKRRSDRQRILEIILHTLACGEEKENERIEKTENRIETEQMDLKKP